MTRTVSVKGEVRPVDGIRDTRITAESLPNHCRFSARRGHTDAMTALFIRAIAESGAAMTMPKPHNTWSKNILWFPDGSKVVWYSDSKEWMYQE